MSVFIGLSSAAKERLLHEGFAASKLAGKHFEWAASRTDWNWLPKLFGGSTHHVLWTHQEEPTPADLTDLFKAGLDYAYVQQPPPVQASLIYFIYPCLTVARMTPELAEYVRLPPKHWLKFEFPVVFDMSTGDVRYQTEKPFWGRLLWKKARVIADIICGDVKP